MPFRQPVAVLHCNSATILDCTAGSSDWSSIAFSMARWSGPPLAGVELGVRSALFHQCRGRLWSYHNVVTARRYRRQQRTRLYKEEKYNSCFVYNLLTYHLVSSLGVIGYVFFFKMFRSIFFTERFMFFVLRDKLLLKFHHRVFHTGSWQVFDSPLLRSWSRIIETTSTSIALILKTEGDWVVALTWLLKIRLAKGILTNHATIAFGIWCCYQTRLSIIVLLAHSTCRSCQTVVW